MCPITGFSPTLTSDFGTDLEIAPTGLEMYGSDPPLWFLSLDGKQNPLELETEDLQLQNRFQKK